jgi:methylglutaconyl-CoA hydratase
LLHGGPIAHSEAKKLIRDVGVLSNAELPEHTARLLARLRGSPEGKEGLTAFLEKRKPNWM